MLLLLLLLLPGHPTGLLLGMLMLLFTTQIASVDACRAQAGSTFTTCMSQA